ncbi:zinc knuckle CX2CX4HX4C containing protein [Tanacetum coccineum]|uniref:Zinc knuckle CX2CX4HX4C containing protein n=1 Tax=Tanacetum coccineum TaxID=301880 RepID=A0ABQ5AEY1_9ASTR
MDVRDLRYSWVRCLKMVRDEECSPSHVLFFPSPRYRLTFRRAFRYPLNGDKEIDFNPSTDIEELERLLADDPVPVPRVFDEPLSNFDLMLRSSENRFPQIVKTSVLVFNPPISHFDPFIEIPSGESKVHIEVLLVLWGNRLPIPDESLLLSRVDCFAGFGCCCCCVAVGYREMDKGFLNRKTTSKKVVDNDLVVTGSALGDLAGKVKNIDGKILGKDGKPMMDHRCVRNPDLIKESVGGDVRLANDVVEQAPHTGERSILVDQQVCIDREAVNHPDLGPRNTMVSDTSRCTNVAPIELNKSSTVTLPKAALDEVNASFVNTLCGFPVGKKLAFLVVENYVKHAWVKFGLKRVMMHCGSFMFQFESKSGMEKVLESDPWRIQLVLFVLKIWKPNTLNLKENVSCVPLWVKMHNVPIVAYSKVGLDLIFAKVGKLMRLDAHINFICLNSWGRSEYARALVEVSAEVPLVDSVDLDIPLEDGKGYTTNVCPRERMAGPVVKCVKHADVKKDKQPMHVIGNKDKGKQVSTQRYIKGYRVNIPKTNLVYRAVVKPQSDNHVTSNMEQSLDTTKQPSPCDSSNNGMTYINDDLSFDELRNFVNQKAEEESVIEFIGNNTNDGCTLRGKQDDKIYSKKPSSSLEVINEDSDTNVDEVLLSDIGISFPSSLFGGGQSLEKEMLNAMMMIMQINL